MTKAKGEMKIVLSELSAEEASLLGIWQKDGGGHYYEMKVTSERSAATVKKMVQELIGDEGRILSCSKVH
jgi:hypothetical protein